MPTAVDPRLELQVSDARGSLDAAQLQLIRFIETHELGARPAYRAQLVFEELVTNALKYGGVTIEPIRVRCALRLTPRELVLEFRDRGGAFDPTSVELAPLSTSVVSAELGGRGLRLVRKVASAFSYRRVGGENISEVRIALEPD
jgi:anti-sigma regulatory factor (Ser/Thr protein kinase)